MPRSVDLFEPYVDVNDPVWISWVKHVDYIKLMVKRCYTSTEILELDKAIYDAMVAFHKVPEYKGFYKPKMHFASHASVNVLRMGPMRG